MHSERIAEIEYEEKSQRLWFVFHGDRLLVKTEAKAVSVPFATDPVEYNIKPFWKMYVGRFGNTPCYSALVDGDVGIPDGMEFQGLRGLFGQLEDRIFGLSGRALQLVRWDYTHQYCSQCGKPAGTRNEEGAQICRYCGYLSYPRISPAVIVAVLKEDKILLAHNHRFPKNRYSVIAGYVEMGESLEACVNREIREETGIEVKNIRYFGSQSWPFTSSLMVAFTAEYASGRISIDTAEIADAGWFSADALPDIPDKVSIARQLIDWFMENHKGKRSESSRR
jgi:NAD+ diphosphatase